MKTKLNKMIRLYCSQKLSLNMIIVLGKNDTHYLKNVMRCKENDQINLFKFNKHDKEIVKRIIKNPKACFGDISPLAIGLKRVLEIFLSMSLSHRSLIIQPADLIEKAPIINIKYISNNLVIESKKIGIVQRHGSNNSQLPIGLSNLPSLIHL